jgi:hypothetical protein
MLSLFKVEQGNMSDWNEMTEGRVIRDEVKRQREEIQIMENLGRRIKILTFGWGKMWYCNLNSGLHAFYTGALPLELLQQPKFLTFNLTKMGI